ncbi:hypothetical protein LR48_Vigan07g131600 [Vigna angularis]|uniref:Uncharacterized protein n=1 Tax=Phaseolus angularis TaxID=3914 RepID=A0A0L9UYF6_PHAAN|nr:hypothetical protein LR48_Vigan07g131600 [Vigna angularis]
MEAITQRKVQESQIPVEEKEEMMRNLERRETEFMRIQRRKIGFDDFEQLTVIGKGAFGEEKPQPPLSGSLPLSGTQKPTLVPLRGEKAAEGKKRTRALTAERLSQGVCHQEVDEVDEVDEFHIVVDWPKEQTQAQADEELR